MFQFIEKFQEVKEATRLASAKATSNGTATGATPVTSANASPITARAALPDPTPLLDPPPQSQICTSPAPNQTPDDNVDSSRNSHQRSQSLSGLQVSLNNHFTRNYLFKLGGLLLDCLS